MPIDGRHEDVIKMNLTLNHWIAKYFRDVLYDKIVVKNTISKQVTKSANILSKQGKPIPFATLNKKYKYATASEINFAINQYLNKWVKVLYQNQTEWSYPYINITALIEGAIDDLTWNANQNDAKAALSSYSPMDSLPLLQRHVNNLENYLKCGETTEKDLLKGPVAVKEG